MKLVLLLLTLTVAATQGASIGDRCGFRQRCEQPYACQRTRTGRRCLGRDREGDPDTQVKTGETCGAGQCATTEFCNQVNQCRSRAREGEQCMGAYKPCLSGFSCSNGRCQRRGGGGGGGGGGSRPTNRPITKRPTQRPITAQAPTPFPTPPPTNQPTNRPIATPIAAPTRDPTPAAASVPGDFNGCQACTNNGFKWNTVGGTGSCVNDFEGRCAADFALGEFYCPLVASNCCYGCASNRRSWFPGTDSCRPLSECTPALSAAGVCVSSRNDCAVTP